MMKGRRQNRQGQKNRLFRWQDAGEIRRGNVSSEIMSTFSTKIIIPNRRKS